MMLQQHTGLEQGRVAFPDQQGLIDQEVDYFRFSNHPAPVEDLSV